MSNFEQKQQVLSRRSIIFSAAITLPFAALVGRLYSLQVVGGQKYRRLSEQNRIAIRLTLPTRGLIYDQGGKTLVDNFKAFRLSVIPEQAVDVPGVLNRVASLIDLPPSTPNNLKKEMKRSPKFMAIPVKDFLTFSEVARLQVNLPGLPGIVVEELQARHYPDQSTASHVLGFMGPVSPQHLQQSSSPLLRQPDFRIGRQGAEAYFDTHLRGQAGTDHMEVNARGRDVRVLSQVSSKKGEDITLTLVTEIQKVAEQKLKGRRGAITVLDTHNGNVLAMASAPDFDPNKFVYGFGGGAWSQLHKDKNKPLLNRCCKGRYPPGSTFKMIVALAALEEGIITPDKMINCSGKITFGDRDFHCWEKKGHGRTNLHEALAKSCDIYFYELGRLLGIEKMKHYAQIFGLGAKTGVFLPENEGLLPDNNWKMRTIGEPWQRGEDLIAAIGQGYILTTPLQLSVMTARLATGLAIKPQLLYGPEKPVFDPLPIKEENLEVIHGAMLATVTEPYGTAYASRLTQTAYAGKTGTSQVVSKRHDMDFITLEEIPQHERTHSLFTAFGPVPGAQFAVSVLLENAGSGSAKAAPAGRDVLLAALKWQRKV